MPDPLYLQANGLQLCYDYFGDKKDPAVLLVMGLGTQMVAWPEHFCRQIADQGYFVIRFDNRDIGLSEKIEFDDPPSIPKLMLLKTLGLPVSVPYDLHDMARDAVGVLDALDIEEAHWVGASMGGMIAQLAASFYPARCKSLTSIMSTTGNPRLKQASLKVRRQLLKKPKSLREEDYLEHTMVTRKMLASPGYPMSDEELKERVLLSFNRNYYPQGYRNQMAAIIATGNRTKSVKRIKAPTLVIHGKQDPLAPVDGGIDTARHIKNSNLYLIDGMGHDLPNSLCPVLAELIIDHTDRAA